MIQEIKNCKIHGPLTKEEVWIYKGGEIRCKQCRILTKKKTNLKYHEKYKKKYIENKYCKRDSDIKHLNCRKCYEDKDLSEFAKSMVRIKYPICKICVKNRQLIYRKKHLENWHRKERDRQYIKKYNITLDDYEAMVKLQKNICLICKKPQTYQRKDKSKLLHVDHCHKTNKIRGLLCYKCNVGLGSFSDSIELLDEAIKYLKLHALV